MPVGMRFQRSNCAKRSNSAIMRTSNVGKKQLKNRLNLIQFTIKANLITPLMSLIFLYYLNKSLIALILYACQACFSPVERKE